MKVSEARSPSMEIKRGIRQGCALAPLLFNLYSEAIFQEFLLSENMGIIINNIRFVDRKKEIMVKTSKRVD